jgi:hypothetical protein
MTIDVTRGAFIQELDAAARDIANATEEALRSAREYAAEHDAELRDTATECAELRGYILRLERRLGDRDAETTAAILYDFFYSRGLLVDHWKLAPSELRESLILLCEEHFGGGEDV